MLASSGDRARDLRLIGDFFQRLATYDLESQAALLLFEGDMQLSLRTSEVFGAEPGRLAQIIQSADLLLNFCGSVRLPLLTLFKRRASWISTLVTCR